MAAAVVATIAATSMSIGTPAGAAPGDTAPGFGTNGVVTTTRGTGRAADNPAGVLRLPDGKLLMVSSQQMLFTAATLDLVRLHPDGRIDTSYGPGGRRSIRIEPVASALSVALQGDKVLVAGIILEDLGSETDVLVARITADGTLDTSFSGDGKAIVDIGDRDEGRRVAAGPGGTVLVGGRTGTDVFALRLTASGARDLTYGVGGVAVAATGYTDDLIGQLDMDMHATASGVVTLAYSDLNLTRVVRLQPNGAADMGFDGDGTLSFDLLPGPESDQQVVRSGDRTYVVAGRSGAYWVRALALDGAADPGFNGGGFLFVDPGEGEVTATDAIVDGSGALVITGVETSGQDSRWSVVRVRSTGDLDGSFSGDGLFRRRLGGTDGARFLLSRPGGYVVLGTRRTDLTVMALRGSGVVRTEFGTNGVRSVNASRLSSGLEIAGLDRGPNGRLLVTGTVTQGPRGESSRFVLLRYRANGSLDTSFSGDGVVTADIAGRDDRFTGARQLSNGKVLAWGSSRGSDSTDAVVMRFTASGAPDTTFGTNGRRTFTADDSFNRLLGVQVAVDAQGRLVVAHLYNAGGQAGIIVRRLRADGSDDASFATAGRRLLAKPSPVDPSDLRLRNGRPMILDLEGLRIVRLTPQGALDLDFGPGGTHALDLGNDYRFARGAIMANGKVVAVRNVGIVESEVARTRASGFLDLSFSDDGFVTIPAFGEPLSQTDRLVVAADGTIVVGGTGLTGFSSSGYDQARSTLTRITPSGELDTTFGGDGRVIRQVMPGGFESVVDTVIASNGDPVVLVQSAEDGLAAHLWRVQG